MFVRKTNPQLRKCSKKRRLCTTKITLLWSNWCLLWPGVDSPYVRKWQKLFNSNWRIELRQPWSHAMIIATLQFNGYHPGRGLAVNFCEKRGEMRWKKNNFHRVFLTSLCGECVESQRIIYFHRVLSMLTKKNLANTGLNLWPPTCL